MNRAREANQFSEAFDGTFTPNYHKITADSIRNKDTTDEMG
jgi:hypothetical protein